MKKIVLLTFVFVLFSTAMVMRFKSPVVAEETIYIRADGSVEGTDKIQREGNVYTFTGNINDSIVVERDNIVVDGAGYTLQGTGNGKGISLTSRSNVFIRNMEIEGFREGIFLNGSSNNIISGNYITNNFLGIWFWLASNNTISGNNITANKRGVALGGSVSAFEQGSHYNNISGNNIINNDVGIHFFGSSNKIIGNYIAKNEEGIYVSGHVPFAGSQNNIIYHNSFIHNTKQVNDVHWEEPFSAISVNIWDDGYPSGGNYWSDYEDRYPNAKELDGSGIWDTPYVIDENNQDRYPLMDHVVIPEFPDEEPPPIPTTEPCPTTWVVAATAIIAIGGVALLVYFTKVKKTTGKTE
ncbi:right-handed parallel beta-helix repeat-containing protein [Candidatus Bathyarchaeota archaeon]|nr:right-handed parallel beta-helix repeat-containing protein [Candidatus Bathyarchaeota archaeon]